MEKIVPFDKKYIGDIADIEKECFSESAWSEKSVAEFYSDKNSPAFLFLKDANAVGYIGGRYLFDEGEIENVAVLPSSRGQKIAQRLLGKLIEEFEHNKVRHIFLEVRKSNSVAIAIYEKFGFCKISERKNYYKAPVEDALIYKLDISEKK